MLTLPAEIMDIIGAFAPVFSERIWDWAQVMVIGAILAPGKRTVSAVLRVMGLGQEKQYQNYHRVLNRATWSSQEMSRILLMLLVAAFVPGGWPVVVGADETLERRRGRKITLLGFFRDGVRSSHKHKVISPGLRWVSLMVLVPVPWSSRVWALPFMTVPAPSQEANQALGKRHKTSIVLIRQMTDQVRRWLPGRGMVLVVDGGLVALKSARHCARYRTPVTYISRLQLNARLFDPPPPQPERKRGRKAVIGPRQLKPNQWLDNPDAPWQRLDMAWYSGQRRALDVLTDTALWHAYGSPPVSIRWVLVRDPIGRLAPQVFCCTNPDLSPETILAYVVMRWSVEVTFEEVRAHLGFETQRQWSDLAITRTSPLILGLFSLVTLLAHRLTAAHPIPSARSAAWYSKPQLTFSDLIAFVRRYLWTELNFLKVPSHPDSVFIPRSALDLVLNTLCNSS